MDIKKWNWYYLADALAVGAIACTAFATAKKSNMYFSSALIFSTSYFGLLAFESIKGITVVKNPYGLSVSYKPEEGVTPVTTNEKEIYGVDGINVNGKVYKLRTGTHITINEDGSITTHAITGKIVNRIGAGLLSAPPDDSWKLLFDDKA